ncbi:MAG TPA: transglycosylase SLT domain-containing protein [Rhodanobacter sp.]|nr:transglycosylase SLT domain-containing protein [Rhodanobacter sp.]
MNRLSRRLLPAAVSLVLAACAGVSPQPRHQATRAAPVPATPIPAKPAATSSSPTVPPETVWDKLRNSFAMSDCDADPQILHWAGKFTHNPARFEQTLRTGLPRLVYVQQVAAQYHVAGEFVLLPWVESRFRPDAPRKHRPAGMWQIMPITAKSMGLRVDRHYDGRLNIATSTHAVMKLLQRYQDQFHDWRLTDYAYNAGEFHVRRIIRKQGMPPATPVIPDWPVRRVTREHLVKLLAMACVVRDPARFHVSLPTLPAPQRLVKTAVPEPMSITLAARQAGMSVDALKYNNGAFRGNIINTDHAAYLMLPLRHARRFRLGTQEDSGLLAGSTTPQANQEADSHAGRSSRAHKTHTVRRGESLWQIAHDYSMDISQLEQLNHLSDDVIQPGQVLHLDSID